MRWGAAAIRPRGAFSCITDPRSRKSSRAFRSGSHGLGGGVLGSLKVCACSNRGSGGSEYVDDDAGRSHFSAEFAEKVLSKAHPVGEWTTRENLRTGHVG
jgi:hypothetical protein